MIVKFKIKCMRNLEPPLNLPLVRKIIIFPLSD